MVSRHRVSLGIVALLALAVLLLPASARQSKPMASARASVEILAERLGHLRGIVVDGTGAAFVTDVRAGTLWRVAPAGRPAVVMGHLKHPVGVALDREGRLVMVEAGRRRILRLDTEGAAPLASGMRQPRWVAAAPDGHLYVTAKNLELEDEGDDEDDGEGEMVVRVTPDGQVGVFADRFQGLQGVAVAEDVLQVVARGRKGERHSTGTLYEIPIQVDGRAGMTQALATNAFVRPAGLATDRLGASFVSAKSLTGEPWHRGVIVKVTQDGTATLFAEGLDDPRGLAFGPDGSLYLADGDVARVLRFVAPREPILEEVPPAITKERQIPLRLRAEVGARLTILGGELAVVAVVDHRGSAVVSVPLRRNAESHLMVFATEGGGLGLTSSPLPLSITQDDEPPSLELLTPRAGALVRGTIAAEARAADLNGIADVEFRLDELMVGLDAAPPFRVSVDTTVATDGLRVVSARARDRAGNVARASAQVTVDNTPPEVRIVAPASGALVAGPLEVVVEAADVTSGVARVELAVNGVSGLVAETPPYRFQLDRQELGPGTNVLVAAAVDRAGNRGESTPVSITLSGVSVTISEPGDGAQVPGGPVLVGGRVEAGGAEVGVAVNGFPAAVQGNTFAALVPVAPDTSTLTATATTASGTTASHSIAITVSSTPAATALLASPQSGVTPLTVRFSLVGAPTASIALDFDGNGTVDFTGPRLNGQTFTYTQPGLYFPTATLTDARGNQFTVTALVQVYDRLALDASLQAKWAAMRDALRRGDIEGALQQIAADWRDEFRADFAAVASFLPGFASVLEDSRLVAVKETHIEYELLSAENGLTFSYYVEFLRDTDGIWRIAFF